MTPQRDNRVKEPALLRAEHNVSKVVNLAGLLCTTVYATKKRLDDGASVNRLAGTIRKSVAVQRQLAGCRFFIFYYFSKKWR